MRLSLLPLAVVALWSGIVSAGVPDPSTSSVAITGQGSACQFRFRADGGLDQMTVSVTVRGPFGEPEAHCSTSVTLAPNPATLALCTCGPISQGAMPNSNGAFQLVFDRIGGRGSLNVCVTALCQGRIALACVPFDFTSPDLDGSCPANPASAVDVIDLGIWANGLPPSYAEPSDYDCSGAVDVLDLATWAGGLGLGCDP